MLIFYKTYEINNVMCCIFILRVYYRKQNEKKHESRDTLLLRNIKMFLLFKTLHTAILFEKNATHVI